jgi:hypothetical protein
MVTREIKPAGYPHVCKQCGQASMKEVCQDCRDKEAWAIVEALAKAQEPIEKDNDMGAISYWCMLCGGSNRGEPGGIHARVRHVESCPYRRAVELLGMGAGK